MNMLINSLLENFLSVCSPYSSDSSLGHKYSQEYTKVHYSLGHKYSQQYLKVHQSVCYSLLCVNKFSVFVAPRVALNTVLWLMWHSCGRGESILQNSCPSAVALMPHAGVLTAQSLDVGYWYDIDSPNHRCATFERFHGLQILFQTVSFRHQKDVTEELEFIGKVIISYQLIRNSIEMFPFDHQEANEDCDITSQYRYSHGRPQHQVSGNSVAPCQQAKTPTNAFSCKFLHVPVTNLC